MKKSRIRQRLLSLFLTAVMILNMYNLTVLAETEPPETAETAELPEETETPEALEEPEVSEEPEEPEEPELSEELETLEVPEPLTVSENTLMVSGDSVADIASVNETGEISGLEDDVLKYHIKHGESPKGAVVNLFDYWQYPDDHNKEEVWDWDTDDGSGEICNMGISQGHLLRFGQTKMDEDEKKKWYYGAWNMYSEEQPYQGIVQNTLGADGFPRLNFGAKQPDDRTFFGNYVDNHTAWLDDAHREESLAYLFSVTKQNSYKDIYKNVQGLFQRDQEGYYYYDSRENFAEFDKANSRFILYDSPGVGKTGDSGSRGYYGQFFPFNKASDVFDTVCDITKGAPYCLSYTGEEHVESGNASFLSCNYDALNHYIGMTLEVPFLQTVGGCLDDDSHMIFTFSGDDDVWIFIDGVLVADLGGIHDAYELTIDFASGQVSIMDKVDHTLSKSFEEAGQPLNGFSGDTFAGNTKHKLQMFYLERGHMASNLSLSFNVVVLEDTKSNDSRGSDSGDDLEYLPLETEDPEEDLEIYSDTKTVSSAQPTGSEQGQNAVGSPQTGDDSMIGWWAALNLISLLGICATVYNLILRNSREKKRVSKGK